MFESSWARLRNSRGGYKGLTLCGSVRSCQISTKMPSHRESSLPLPPNPFHGSRRRPSGPARAICTEPMIDLGLPHPVADFQRHDPSRKTRKSGSFVFIFHRSVIACFPKSILSAEASNREPASNFAIPSLMRGSRCKVVG